MASDRKTVLVTGAAGGIGRAACERLAKNGWNVLAVDRDAAKLAWVGNADHLASCAADIVSEEDNRRIVAEAMTRFGALHAIILNAAVKGGGSIDELLFADFQRVISVNLFGAVLGIKAALPELRRQPGSSIVLTSSTHGLTGDPENWAYCASKHAVIGLVRSLARELGADGIRVNALCPGLTRATGMTEVIETIAPAHYESLKKQVPLQRWGEPDEMAAVLEFLLSPAASYVNGHALVADGGTMVGSGLLPPSSGKQRVIPGGINE